MPSRVSSHNEIEILMSFDYLNLFRPNEHNEEYHIRKPNDEIFQFEVGDKKFVYVGDKEFSFETNDEIVKFSSEHGFNDVKFPFFYGEENIYFMLHQKYIAIREYESSTEKTNYQYSYKKMKN